MSLAVSQKLNPFETEGVKYAGSKLKLSPFISQFVRRVKLQKVIDGFTATRVSAEIGTCPRKSAKRRETLKKLFKLI